MTIKKGLFYVVFIVGVFSTGYYFGSGTVETTTETARKDKETEIVERVVERIVTVTEKPDGTKVTKTHDKTEDKKKNKTSNETQEVTKSKPTYKPQWAIHGSTSVVHTEGLQSYTIGVDRRVFANVWGGVYARSNLQSGHEVGVGLRIEF